MDSFPRPPSCCCYSSGLPQSIVYTVKSTVYVTWHSWPSWLGYKITRTKEKNCVRLAS